MATYGYARVASPNSAWVEKIGLAQQQREIRNFAVSHGLELAEIFVDPGVSVYIPIGARGGGMQLLETLDAGDTLVVCKIDRLYYSALDAVRGLEDLAKGGVEVVILEIGEEPVTWTGRLSCLWRGFEFMPEGVGGREAEAALERRREAKEQAKHRCQTVMGILNAVAEFEREKQREAVKVGKAKRGMQGGWVGGGVPYGFKVVGKGRDAVLALHPNEQRVIAFVHQLHKKGMSLREISGTLLDKGWVNRQGRAFAPAQISRMLAPPSPTLSTAIAQIMGGKTGAAEAAEEQGT